MRIPILSGIYADASPEFRTSYPRNLVPVPKPQGISEGYLKVADGLVRTGKGPGIARGGIDWEGTLYRVMGTSLVSIAQDGTATTLGDVGGTGPVSMTYDFNRLAVASGGNLFYWDKSALTQVTDTDLGTALDVIWIDGYFMTTDGEFIVVTDLTNPLSVNPLRYGSSEVDPDPIVAVKRLRDEVFAVNRYSIEMFRNAGGTGFPFQVIRGAQVEKGAVGTHACAVFAEALAFVGGGREESVGVHVGGNGTSAKISTREVDIVLEALTEAELEAIEVEVVKDKGHNTLMVHLPAETWCYDAAATAATGQPVWYSLASGISADAQYRGRYFTFVYGAWQVADTKSEVFGRLDRAESNQWGRVTRWEFGTPIVYDEARGAMIHEIELVGSVAATAQAGAVVMSEHSQDGMTWSNPRSIEIKGDIGQSFIWTREGHFNKRRMYRFQGDTNAPMSIAAVEAKIEGMAW